ncbi:hypothetical protein SAMD00019534_011760 [Acytostelium subglobosum LB1]|uniref:hypothetical protein n=1 Tax=Acytostelium subglobosum LB1 TaxID=1410327 RepID=UPI0006448DDC|nr:hypothetical protein SAMD00019534_011760 [Acytostelium subglobosum LB1]GAM18001.1 hypothetical protein SAMD00019534_011760 [Acytostelium subglobosum LB1]|eukprot:XP_012758597.1 hypothetical protein SAMD00019534_011760 [Acytostelium subglobosum LB1]
MDQSDDRKRREPPGATDERPSKRLTSSMTSTPATASSAPSEPMSGSSTPLALSINATASTPVVESKDVLLSQNREMKFKVDEQKVEIRERENKIRFLTGKLKSSEETLSCLCRVWHQLNYGLEMLSGRLAIESTETDAAAASAPQVISNVIATTMVVAT